MNINRRSGNKNIRFALIAAGVVVVGGFSYSKYTNNPNRFYKDSPVIAKVDGEPVYQVEADQIIAAVMQANNGKKIEFNDLDEKSKTTIVREVAAQRAMLKEAENKGIKEDNEIRRKVYEYKNKLIRDQLLSKFASTEVTPEKLTEKYSELEKSIKGKTRIHVSHILVDSEDKAKKAADALKSEPFAKVAKELSVDSSTKDRGGDIGYLLTGDMDPDFEKAALALKQGEVSQPVKTKFGWHIIKLEEKKLATLAPFESLKGRIAQEIYTDGLKQYADNLLTKTKIELTASSTTAVAKSGKKDDAKPLEDVKPAAGKETDADGDDDGSGDGEKEAPKEDKKN